MKLLENTTERMIDINWKKIESDKEKIKNKNWIIKINDFKLLLNKNRQM